MICISGPFDFVSDGKSVGMYYDRRSGLKDLFSESGIKLPEHMKHVSSLRKNEFMAGRLCAKEALNSFGLEVEILQSSSNRTPIWPEGFIGSITHNDFFAAAFVAKTCDYSGVGIDSEPIVSKDACKNIMEHVLLETETTLLLSSGIDLLKGATLIFSAKESVYKCHFPKISEILNPQDVKILEIDFSLGQFKYLLTHDSIQITGIGRFELSDSFAHTLVLDASPA